MVNVTNMGALVVLTNVPEIFPVPDDGMPVTSASLSRVQLMLAPSEGVATMVVIDELLHIVCAWVLTITVGFSVIVIGSEQVLEQPLASVMFKPSVNEPEVPASTVMLLSAVLLVMVASPVSDQL